MASIFVQIASYRDPQLVPTVQDLIKNAASPDQLSFGIAWQHAPDEAIPEEWWSDPRFSILDIPAEKSQGACWARNRLQSLYKGQTYTLQLDSHHRFVQHWDRHLVRWIQRLQKRGVAKPLLTAYLPSFDPNNDPAARVHKPRIQIFHTFTEYGILLTIPKKLRGWRSIEAPVPARFFSAHFCFTLGLFCKEVPHDPHLYFHGEEISLAARAYTHGYDLFHPHRVVAWHEYTRKYRTKHWNDDAKWRVRDALSQQRTQKLLGIDGASTETNFGVYGLGTSRTLADYEAYAGLSFSQRRVMSS